MHRPTPKKRVIRQIRCRWSVARRHLIVHPTCQIYHWHINYYYCAPLIPFTKTRWQAHLETTTITYSQNCVPPLRSSPQKGALTTYSSPLPVSVWWITWSILFDQSNIMLFVLIFLCLCYLLINDCLWPKTFANKNLCFLAGLANYTTVHPKVSLVWCFAWPAAISCLILPHSPRLVCRNSISDVRLSHTANEISYHLCNIVTII